VERLWFFIPTGKGSNPFTPDLCNFQSHTKIYIYIYIYIYFNSNPIYIKPADVENYASLPMKPE
jgi:hypothetical protein